MAFKASATELSVVKDKYRNLNYFSFLPESSTWDISTGPIWPEAPGFTGAEGVAEEEAAWIQYRENNIRKLNEYSLKSISSQPILVLQTTRLLSPP